MGFYAVFYKQNSKISFFLLNKKFFKNLPKKLIYHFSFKSANFSPNLSILQLIYRFIYSKTWPQNFCRLEFCDPSRLKLRGVLSLGAKITPPTAFVAHPTRTELLKTWGKPTFEFGISRSGATL